MIYLTVIPGVINVVDAEPLFTKTGGFKLGDRYFYPPHWHLSLEEAKEFLFNQKKLHVDCQIQKLAELQKELQTPPEIVNGPPTISKKINQFANNANTKK